MRSITVREWINKFINGEFETKDFDTQTKAGWNDWFCPERELSDRLKKMGNIIKKIKNDYIFDNFFLVFYNICSIDYPLFDQAMFTPFRRIVDKNFEIGLSFDCPYNGYKYEVCTARNNFHTEFYCNTDEELFEYLKQLTDDYKKEEMNTDCQHQK